MIDFDAVNKEEKYSNVVDFSSTMPTPLDYAKHHLMQFRSAIQAMQAEVNELDVDDSKTEAKAAEMTAQLKKIGKAIAEKQESIIGEASKFVNQVQKFTLPFRKDIEAIEAQVKRKLAVYGYKKELQRRAEEAAARAAAAEVQAKIDAEASALGIEPVTIPLPVIPVESGPIRTESGTTSFVKKWTYEVVDVSAIPARYMMADPTNRTAVMQDIRAGVREIPGLRIFEAVTTRTTT